MNRWHRRRDRAGPRGRSDGSAGCADREPGPRSWQALVVPSLIAVDVHGREEFLRSLEVVWAAGDAVLPVDTNAPRAHLDRILDGLGPEELWFADGERLKLSGGYPVDDGTAVVIATSGTTGEPKGVVHTHRTVTAAAAITADATSTTPHSTWVACLPLGHIGGFSVITRALHAGAGLVVMDGFDRDEVDSAPQRGATHVSLVPTVLDRVDPSRWELILLGGSAIPEDRPANSLATYGMTETFGGVVYDGLPLRGVEVRTAGDGHIEVRSPTLATGYRSRGASTNPMSMTADGFYRTGDVGVVDPSSGSLRVHGRADDMIITGGVKVWPQPVEEVLTEDPLVAECAVVGLEDPEWGQAVTAVVVPSTSGRPPTLAGLRDRVKERLPSAHAPRHLVLVETLERTTSGKIRRNDVRLAVEGTYHR